MSTYTVNASSAPGLAEIAASLPLSLAPADGFPQIAAVAGSPGWTAAASAALDAGALAAVVASPCADDAAPHLAEASAGRTVLAWEFAANPGVLSAADAAAALRGRAVLAEATLRVPAGSDLDAALLDLMVAAGRILGEFAAPELLIDGPSGRHLSSRLDNGAPVSLGLVVTSAGPASLRVRVLTEDGGLTALIPHAETAAPAEVRVTAPDGERLLPTLWETSRRASWRRAVAIASGGPASGDVAELHRTAALLPRSADRDA